MATLPPFAALRAFDAAARRLSFRDAAEELGLTPTAVSHQVRRLEDLTETKLFHRSVRAVALTEAGDRFARDIAPPLRALEASFASLQQGEERQVVVIGAGPVFLSRWLAPRLAEFAATHPDIDLRLHNSPADLSRRRSEFDIAIAWGTGEWPNVSAQRLLELSATPLLAPSLVSENGGPAFPKDMLTLPLLHHQNDTAWLDWLKCHGLAAAPNDGAKFEDANVLSHAAICGQGVMLGCPRLFAEDISSGRLIQPFRDAQPVKDAYYLLSPGQNEPAVATVVRTWLMQQALQLSD